MKKIVMSAAAMLAMGMYSGAALAGGPDCDSMKQGGHEHSAEYHKQVMPQDEQHLTWESVEPQQDAAPKKHDDTRPASNDTVQGINI